MSLVYLIALAAVGVVILGTLADALHSVARKPRWATGQPVLAAVATVDRRSRSLPFVGKERRAAQAPGSAVEADQRAA